MRGRKPKPTRVKEVTGNPGKRPLNDQEPQLAAGVPDIPAHLNDVARAEWERIAPQLAAAGVLTQADRAALAGYCVAWARWVEAEEKVRASGLLLKDKDSGKLFKNPFLAIANEALAQMRGFASEFGLSPASRSRVKAQGKAAADPMAEFLNAKAN